jgi:hypothetical protein
MGERGTLEEAAVNAIARLADPASLNHNRTRLQPEPRQATVFASEIQNLGCRGFGIWRCSMAIWSVLDTEIDAILQLEQQYAAICQLYSLVIKVH